MAIDGNDDPVPTGHVETSSLVMVMAMDRSELDTGTEFISKKLRLL